MLLFDRLVYEYRPFPLGVASPFIDPSLYAELAATYPSAGDFPLFRRDSTGAYRKFSLSGRSDPKLLADFLDRHPAWRSFYEYLYSVEFMDTLLDHLEARGIQVIRRRSRGLARGFNRIAPRMAGTRIAGLEWLSYQLPRVFGGVSSKVEFSAIPGRDGGLMPHTDAYGKIVTLVFSFPQEGEWSPDYGGGTSIVEPRDETLYFNRYNRKLPFDAVDVKRVVDYRPNQAMLFIKTFNSWHAVMPTHGPSDAWRKTLTVNLMAD